MLRVRARLRQCASVSVRRSRLLKVAQLLPEVSGGRRGSGWETQKLSEGISGASSGMRLADGYHKGRRREGVGGGEGGPSAPWDTATDRKWRRWRM